MRFAFCQCSKRHILRCLWPIVAEEIREGRRQKPTLLGHGRAPARMASSIRTLTEVEFDGYS